MNGKAKEETSEHNTFRQYSPKQGSNEDTEQTFRTTTCADSCNHWIQKPYASIFQRSFLRHMLVVSKDAEHHPARNDVSHSEKNLSK